jgi:hypothetical protein
MPYNLLVKDVIVDSSTGSVSTRKTYYQLNKAKILRQRAGYYQKTKQKRLAYRLDYYQKNTDNILEQKKLYRLENKERINDGQRHRMNKSNKGARMIVLQHYSRGVPQCACCGELIYEFLTMDHIDGKKKWNHDLSYGGHKLYNWLINNEFPDGFQVLCCNCNFARGKRDGNGTCPHQKIIRQTLFPDISK